MFSLRLDGPTCLWALLLLRAFHICLAEDDANDQEYEDKKDDGCMMVVFMSLIFAFCISFCGSLLAYVSVIDDVILKRYQAEAFVVRADVCSAEFARQGKQLNNFFNKDESEYSATIEYNQTISDCYRIRIRKQIKALESDFVDPDLPADPDNKQVDQDEALKQVDLEVPKQESTEPLTIANKESFFKKFSLEQKKMEVLVLNGKPLSGIPKRVVDRRLGMLYKITSLFAILATICLTGFCFYMAVKAIGDAKDDRERTAARIAIGIVGALIAMEIPFIHATLNAPIVAALEEEYFESADLTPPGQDESSLSSGSDAFLSSKSYPRLLSMSL